MEAGRYASGRLMAKKQDPPRIKEALAWLRKAEDFIIVVQLPKERPDLPDVHVSRTHLVATDRYKKDDEAKADMAHVLGTLSAYLYAQGGKIPASVPSTSLIVSDPNPPPRMVPGRQILSTIDWLTEDEYGDGPVFALAKDVFADGEPLKEATSSNYAPGAEYARAHFEEFSTWAREVAAVQIAFEMGWNAQRTADALSDSLIVLRKAFENDPDPA